MPDILEKLIIPLVLLAGQLWLNSRFKRYDQRHENERAAKEERHAEEAGWRNSVSQTMADQDHKIDELVQGQAGEIEWRNSFTKHIQYQDEKIELLMGVQATTMRSDIIHKCHRYIDDLGEASIEEKDALHAQWEEYKKFCDKNGIENNFIDEMVAKVKALPDRKVKS